jgi:hypothetical protein
MTFLPLFLAVSLTPAAPERPNKQPQLATDGQAVALAYGSGNTIYFARSDDGGKTFSTPAVVSRDGVISLGARRGPRIAFASGAIVVSAIVGEKGRGADGDLLSWRSTDGGKTWSAPVKVNDVSGSAREGLHAMSGDGKALFATWLDLRSKGTRLYGSSSSDGGATWSKNVLVYESPSGSICECCHPSVVAGAGRIAVMFRNQAEGARDMYVTTSTDGGRTFSAAKKLGTGTWMLNACPMDGGGLLLHPKGVMAAWRRDKTVFLSVGDGAETQIGAGKDPVIAPLPRGPVVAWTSPEGLVAQVPGSDKPALLDPRGAYASLLPLRGGAMLAAWESGGTIRIEPIETPR